MRASLPLLLLAAVSLVLVVSAVGAAAQQLGSCDLDCEPDDPACQKRIQDCMNNCHTRCEGPNNTECVQVCSGQATGARKVQLDLRPSVTMGTTVGGVDAPDLNSFSHSGDAKDVAAAAEEGDTAAAAEEATAPEQPRESGPVRVIKNANKILDKKRDRERYLREKEAFAAEATLRDAASEAMDAIHRASEALVRARARQREAEIHGGRAAVHHAAPREEDADTDKDEEKEAASPPRPSPAPPAPEDNKVEENADADADANEPEATKPEPSPSPSPSQEEGDKPEPTPEARAVTLDCVTLTPEGMTFMAAVSKEVPKKDVTGPQFRKHLCNTQQKCSKTVDKFRRLEARDCDKSLGRHDLQFYMGTTFMVHKAGRIRFRYGGDWDKGGMITLDDVVLKRDKHKRSWGRRWDSDHGVTRTRWFDISPGQHRLEIYGAQKCCDSKQSVGFRYKAHDGSFKTDWESLKAKKFKNLG